MTDQLSDVQLKAAFAARSTQPRTDCPPPDVIWDAVTLVADVDVRLGVIEHVALCADCMRDWQIAAELDRVSPHSTAASWRPSAGWLATAAGLIVVVGAVGIATHLTVPVEPAYRGARPVEAVATAAEIPREHFTLHWAGGGQGASYTLRVFNQTLSQVLLETVTEQTTYQVPASALATVPAGASVYWQVETRMPGELSAQTAPPREVKLR